MKDSAAWVEFHDSTLQAVSQSGTAVSFVLDAYVHRWEKIGDARKGTGWIQPVRILANEVAGQIVRPDVPIDIANGRLHVGPTTHSNLVPLPFRSSDAVTLWLQLAMADVVECVGRGVRVDAIGDARYVEDYSLPACPPDRRWNSPSPSP